MIETFSILLDDTEDRENMRLELSALIDDGYTIIAHGFYQDSDRQPMERFTLYKPDNVEKVDANALTLAVITSLERGETKNNQRPMWRCTTDIGEKVNIFLNTDEPEKDSFHLFEQAGWGQVLNELMTFSTMDTQIFIAMQKKGQWWEIVKVSPYQVQGDMPF